MPHDNDTICNFSNCWHLYGLLLPSIHQLSRLAQDPEAKLIKVSQTMSKACSFECWIWQVLFCHFVSVPNQPLSLNILAMKSRPMCTIHSKSLLTESNTGPTLDLCRGLMCLVQIRMKGRNAFGSRRLPCIASLQAGVFLIIFQCFSSSWGIMSGSSSCGSRWTDSTAHTSWCWCFHCCHCFSSCLICFDPMMHTRTRAHRYTWSFNQNPARNWESGRRFQDDRQLFLGRSTRRKRAVMVRPTGNDMLEKIPLRFCHMNQPESFLASQQSNFPGGTSEQCCCILPPCLSLHGSHRQKDNAPPAHVKQPNVVTIPVGQSGMERDSKRFERFWIQEKDGEGLLRGFW